MERIERFLAVSPCRSQDVSLREFCGRFQGFGGLKIPEPEGKVFLPEWPKVAPVENANP